jgi:segregation and condensation protein B
MSDQTFQRQIEALIFASEQSVTKEELSACLNAFLKREVREEEILTAIEAIKERYAEGEMIVELTEINNGYQFLTKKTYHELLNLLIIQKEKKKLSTSAMETLAIIAYKQPITKTEIEQIRGVNCDYSVQKLLEKELISISGRSSGPGKPILYETSEVFMDHFGLKSQTELPQLKDMHTPENTIGENAESSES